MFKKSLLIMLLMAMFAPWAANAQTRAIVYQKVTTAPSDWTTGSYLLVYNDSKAATNSTTTSGSTIYLNTVSVTVESNTIENLNGAEVITLELYTTGKYYIKNSEGKYLKAIRSGSSTKYPQFSWVSSSDVYNCVWQFAFNSGNITLKWENNNDYKMAVSGNYITLSSTASNFSLYAQANIQVDYPKPTGLDVTALGSTTATLSWTAPTSSPKEGYSLTGYKYKESSAASWSSVITTTSCDLTGLTANTQYTYQVVAVYTNDNDETDIQDSDSVETTFTTDCAALSLPTQTWGFEGSSSLPDCWQITSTYVYNNNTYPQIYTNAGALAHGGSNVLRFAGSYPTVLLPAINESLNGKTLKFYARTGSTNGSYSLTIGYYNSSNEFVAYETITSFNGSAYPTTANEVDFSGLPNYVRKVAIQGYTSNYFYYLYVDDVTIEVTASCKPVKNLSVGTITSNSAKLKWTAGNAETNWKLQYKTSAAENYSTVNVSSTDLDGEGYYTLGSLADNTTYNWQVAAWCDPTDPTAITDYVTGTNFTTIQTPVVVDADHDFSDDFEGSNNWVFVNGTQTNQWVIGTAAHNGEGSTKALYISNDGGTTHAYSGTSSTTYVTKSITFAAGTYNFQYDWICNGEKSSYGSTVYDYFRVALAPATTTLAAGTTTITYNNVPSGWIALDGGALVQQNSWTTKTVNDVEISAGTYLLVFMWTNDSQVYQVPAGVDNFSIMAQSCFAPSDLQVTSGTITSSQATLTWTPGTNSQTQWQVAYKAGNFNPESDTYSTATANTTATITLDNLDPSTQYYAYVRAICDDTDPSNIVYSSWSESTNFITECGVKSLPYSYDFETATDMICWAMESCADGTGRSSTYGVNASYCFKFNNSTNPPQYLISPELDGGNYKVYIEFSYKRGGQTYAETFKVGYSTTTDAIASFDSNWEDEVSCANNIWNTYSQVFPAGTKYIAIQYTADDTYALYIDNISIKPCLTKSISGYTQISIDNDCATNEVGWYLIASPVVEDITPSADNGFITSSTYDLYRFNQSAEDEWENWKQEGDHYQFNIESGKGYLYANSEDVTLQFTGTPYTGNGEIALDYLNDNPSDEYMYGWNLVGNPFGTAATVDKDYYRLGQNSRNFIAGTNGTTVEAMEGIFVKAEGEGENVTFTPATQNANANSDALVVMNLSQNRGNLIDRAIVRFNESRQLPKFMLNPANTKIYIPQDGKDYAIATAEAQGEMPVNFKARENGTYTLTVNPENVEMGYLHLIDNMTGTDIDLLQTPSYTFNSTTRDYESRFRLVFSANDENGASIGSATFAFFSNGNLIIGNEGEATLQVVDLMGRVLSSETINGSHSMSLNVAPGVYMIRLINGNNVKVQKIVVR